jgi:DNA-binding NtrC family response regulator
MQARISPSPDQFEVESPLIVITHDPEYRELLAQELTGSGLKLALPGNLLEARQTVAALTAPVVVIDGSLPNESWNRLLEDLDGMEDPPKIVIVRAHSDKERSLRLIGKGAYGIFNNAVHASEIRAVAEEARARWQLPRIRSAAAR